MTMVDKPFLLSTLTLGDANVLSINRLLSNSCASLLRGLMCPLINRLATSPMANS